jgi:hypothetical protein
VLLIATTSNFRVSEPDAEKEETAAATNVDQFIGRYATIAI